MSTPPPHPSNLLSNSNWGSAQHPVRRAAPPGFQSRGNPAASGANNNATSTSSTTTTTTVRAPVAQVAAASATTTPVAATASTSTPAVAASNASNAAPSSAGTNNSTPRNNNRGGAANNNNANRGAANGANRGARGGRGRGGASFAASSPPATASTSNGDSATADSEGWIQRGGRRGTRGVARGAATSTATSAARKPPADNDDDDDGSEDESKLDSAPATNDDYDQPLAGRGGSTSNRGAGGRGRGRGAPANRGASSDRGRGGANRGGRGGGRGGAAVAATPQPAAATPAIPAPAPVVVAPLQPVLVVAPPASRLAAGRDGVFTLVTLAPLSDSGVEGTTETSYRGNAAVQSSPPVSTSESSPSPPPPPVDNTAAEEEEKKAAQDAWFQADEKSNIDEGAHDQTTSDLLDFVVTLVDGDVPNVTLTTQQASIIRYLILRPDEKLRQHLTTLRSAVDAGDANFDQDAFTRFTSALDEIVTTQLTTEESCHEQQLGELEALQSIFGQARELMVYQTYPITLKLTVALQEFHCNIELGFLLPPTYPLFEPVIVSSFIPPPYQGLRISRNDVMVTVDELLQTVLESKARELVETGDCSIYACIEEARTFMESHATLLQTSLEQRDTDTSNLAQRVLVNEGISIFGRGRIERLEYEAIKSVQEACDLNESMAKSKLIAEKWNVEQTIEKITTPASSPTSASSSSSSSKASSKSSIPSSSSTSSSLAILPNVRQRSIQQRADSDRFSSIQAHYATYRTDPEAVLTCSACFESFQLREVAGHACGCVMCVSCWRRMLSLALQQGHTTIKCPGHKCTQSVEEGVLLTLLKPTYYQRYRRYLQDSFIKLRGWKWCVNRKCNNVASAREGDEYAVVACTCHEFWCYSCGREGHWPVSCETSRAYETSKLVLDMRRKVEAKIGKIKDPDEDVKVDVKKCPKCQQPWERNGGCNHFKCGSCQHHFCWMCLGDWADHGVSWFQCPRGSQAEKKAEKLIFGADQIAAGDFEQLYRQCERELVHYLAVRRVQRIINEVETRKELNTHRQQSSQSSSSSSSSTFFPPELPSLIHDLQYPLLSLLSPVLAFLLESHSILRSSYVFFTINFKILDLHLNLPEVNRSDVARKVWFDLNQFEYFVDSLDATILPPPEVRRSMRTIAQMNDTMNAVRKYAKEFANSLKHFKAAILKDVNEDEATKAFFVAVDKSMTSTLLH